MDPESRDKEKAPFACDVFSVGKVTVTNTGLKKEHAARGDEFIKFPHPGCEYSSSRKCRVADHLIGFHGTAKSFACDHPGCTFRSTWRKSIASHKQHMHSDVKPFACTACSFCAKTRSNLSRHKNAVHLNIRVSKRCHVCQKGFQSKSHLRIHMTTHEGDSHEIAKCEDCSVNLKCLSSLETKPAVGVHSRKSSHIPPAGKLIQCDHPGCDYKGKWKSTVLLHKNDVHSEEKPFLCCHTGCSFRCKTESGLTCHQNQVHLNIKAKQCHVCDKRFFSQTVLRAHMLSQHQTKDHDMDECGNCVVYLKRNHKRSQALRAANKRRAGKIKTNSTANKQDIDYRKTKDYDEEENSFAFPEEEIKIETNATLNEYLIDVHMDMQLFSCQ